jgi:hypothetical protein
MSAPGGIPKTVGTVRALAVSPRKSGDLWKGKAEAAEVVRWGGALETALTLPGGEEIGWAERRQAADRCGSASDRH